MPSGLLQLVVLLALAVSSAHPASIRHIVLLIEENRSFDHIFGFRHGVNGLTGRESNPVDPFNTSRGRVFVNDRAPDVAVCDPDHDLPPTTWKIYGPEAARTGHLGTPTMDGFVSFEFLQRNASPANSFCGVMESLSEERTPVLNALADAFVLMDAFHASVPGPTWPNRMFCLSGTSAGQTETDNPWFEGTLGKLFPQRTIFDQLEDAGLSWINYVGDGPWDLFMESIARRPENIVEMGRFFSDAREGTLPTFSYISPRAGMSFESGECANDMHPDHSVAEGELLIKNIYEALVASPLWNETLFIVTFDEHGGFYDHVHPPTNVPPPDDYPSFPDNFTFDRLGVRIPTLLISPWVPRGVVEGAPPAASKPEANSAYELSSIISSVRKLLGESMKHTQPLTRRDAWAATFAHVLSETTPRTDVPWKLPEPAPRPHYHLEATNYFLELEGRKPVNGLQRHILEVVSHVTGAARFSETVQANVSSWIAHATGSWKRRRGQPLLLNLQPRCQSYLETTYVSGWWTIHNSTDGLVALSVTVNGSEFCMKGGSLDNPTSLRLFHCTTEISMTLEGGGSPFHEFRLNPDFTIELARSANPAHSRVCITSGCTSNNNVSSAVYLAPCTERLGQRWSIFPANPDDNFSSHVYLSEGGVWAIVAVEWPNG